MAFELLLETGLGQRVAIVTLHRPPTDGDTVTLNDGSSTVVFEFETTGGVGAGNIEVAVGTSREAAAINLAAAIEANLDMTTNIQDEKLNQVYCYATSGTASKNGTYIAVRDFDNANSYVTVSEADDILDANIHASTWRTLDTVDKAKLLVFATQFLDDRSRWNGALTVETSPLRWPRTGAYTRDNVAIASTSIVFQLKRLVAYVARYMVDQDRTIERGQDAIKSLKADVIEIEFNERYRLASLPQELHFMVEGLGSIRGSTSGMAKILRS